MKRPFPRFEVLGLTVALVGATACTPSNSVQPGAPVLLQMSVIENGGASITTVMPDTGVCPTGTADQGACASAAYPACKLATTNVLCRCLMSAVTPPPPPPADAGATDGGKPDAGASDAASADAARPDGSSAGTDAAGSDAAASDAAVPPPLDGTWSCSFAPISQVLYVFDRLLDTAPFEAAPDLGVPDVATHTFTPANAAAGVLASYASDGVAGGTIFPMLGFPEGPSIRVSGAPALPTGNTISLTLNNTKVLAKDGTTHYAATGALQDGAITFVTQPFSAAVAPPPLPMAVGDAAAPSDQAPDMTPATIAFNNLVDPAGVGAHVTVVDGAAKPVDVDVVSMDGLNATVTPKTTWPAGATITITVDATMPDLVGDTLGAPASTSFMTSAN